MLHPFEQLKNEYRQLLSVMRVTDPITVDGVAKKLLRFKPRYQPVSNETGVPISVIGPFHQRESGADFSTNLAQGDSLARPSIHVPKGRPVLGAPPNDHFPVTWEYAAIDAIRYDHLDDNSAPWSLEYACWKAEAWNGFGPRNHGRHSGYLWSKTNIYDGGKYVADGVWNPNVWDSQVGVIPVMLRMIELDPTLAFGTETVPVIAPIPTPQLSPVGVGGDDRGTLWIQRSLNILGYGPLVEDSSYGRRTREAVRQFQTDHDLAADGLAGPNTIPVIETALQEKSQ